MRMNRSKFITRALATAVTVSLLTSSAWSSPLQGKTDKAIAANSTEQAAATDKEAVVINVDNFNKAQTDLEYKGILKLAGGINKLHHNRTPTPVDKQNVIRMNRDTLYSLGVVDISKGATVTLPDNGKRYMSLMVINNDGYVNKVFYGRGSYKLTMDEFQTPYVGLVIRTLANPEDKADLAIAHELQDKIKIDAASAQPFALPNYGHGKLQGNARAGS